MYKFIQNYNGFRQQSGEFVDHPISIAKSEIRLPGPSVKR